MHAMTIGRLSRTTGVKIETIRYYEKIGLIAEPDRSSGGHRLYDAVSVDRLNFIKRGRELGFSIGDIRDLLGLQGAAPTCAEAYRTALHHRALVREKLRDLRSIDRRLTDVIAGCTRDGKETCAVLDVLSGHE
ncbi:MAG: MerR family transcriptional regulator [Maricaulis sp.]|nr:MerR family transcriptional regulator [Maricaulis sp.]HAQ34098.1 MerR family transcriptional regulator [Alphaproteobacteria bacterium]